ncbi:MAG: AAC(3) family N-acetyltransferase [Anaerolineales bacterium]|jgi:aminoglycoside 3-N-acetyltransferase
MSEGNIVQKTPQPRTRGNLTEDLRRLGLKPGMVVLVHSSLSALGWVNGGPVAVIQALMDALTPDGTLMMPSHSGDLSDPANWSNPPVPAEWHQTIRETMPAYDPHITPTRGIGRVAELFRTFPGVIRSGHPALSFAAWGRQANFLTEDHRLEWSLGEHSPLARLYELDGHILLLGANHDNNTSLHLAQYRVEGMFPAVTQGAPVMQEDGPHWVQYQDLELETEGFEDIGKSFQAAGGIITGRVGSAEAQLMRQRTLVDYAVIWFQEHEPGS